MRSLFERLFFKLWKLFHRHVWAYSSPLHEYWSDEQRPTIVRG